MIDLTPLDVRKKKEDFKRALRGYDSLQVEAFLDVVADRLEQLVREHGSLADKVGHLEGQLKTYQERERALNEALLAAQELREEARSQAERDAAVRLREAETHAEAILLDADQAIRHSQRRLEDLRLRRGQFLKSLRMILERFEDYMELEDTRLEAEPHDMGDLLERLQGDIRQVAAAPPPAPAPAASPPAASPPVEAGPIDVDLSARPDIESQAVAAPESVRNGDRTLDLPAHEAGPDDAAVTEPEPIAAPPSTAPGGSDAASS